MPIKAKAAKAAGSARGDFGSAAYRQIQAASAATSASSRMSPWPSQPLSQPLLADKAAICLGIAQVSQAKRAFAPRAPLGYS